MGDKMINWLSSDVTTPDCDREIIMKNSKKVIFDKGTGMRCDVDIFPSCGNDRDTIADYLDSYGFDLWAYTDEGDQHE